MNKNPDLRLGTRGGFNEIIGHPFFTAIMVDKVKSQKTPAPFKPEISGEQDTSNFDEIYTNQPVDVDFHHDEAAKELLEKSKEQFEDLVY